MHLIALIAYIKLLIAMKKKWDAEKEKKRLIAVCELQCNIVYIQFIIFETTSSSNENEYYTNKKKFPTFYMLYMFVVVVFFT